MHRAVIINNMWTVTINHRPNYEFKEFKDAYRFAKMWKGNLNYRPAAKEFFRF